MRALSSADILRVWEGGASQHPLDRALTLLTVTGERRTDLARLPIGERDRRLWELREATFGSAVEALTQCPACGGRIEFQFSVSDVRVPCCDARMAEPELIDEDWCIRFRLPGSRDLAAIATASGPSRAEAELAAQCLVSAGRNGSESSTAEVPHDVWEAMQRKMSELDPQAEVSFALSCPICRHEWHALFDIAEFLWTEITTFARRLLREVDLLARAYGWSEREILTLSPARRQGYLELASA